jgi:hypothetical protein
MTQDIDKGCIANATTESDEHGEIEVTEEMIRAAAKVLWAEPLLEPDMTMGWAEDIATRMLRCALEERLAQKENPISKRPNSYKMIL